LQVYINGHNILANQPSAKGIKYSLIDNAFDYIENFEKAKELADNADVKRIHKSIDFLADKYCPIPSYFNQAYHGSIMQAEYATDIVFKNSNAFTTNIQNLQLLKYIR